MRSAREREKGRRMKRVITAVLVLALGLALFGCTGSNNSNNSNSSNSSNNSTQNGSGAGESATVLDKTYTIADGNITFNVSSTWKESAGAQDGNMHEYVFQAGTGTFSITYYIKSTTDPYDAYEYIQTSYPENFNVTNFKELSQNQTTRNGMTFTVFEYSYNDPRDGDTIERLAIISKGESQVVIFFFDYASSYDPTDFDGLIDSLKWV